MITPKKNPAAVALGKRARGKPKTYTPEQIALRKDRLTAARAKRWPKPEPTPPKI